MATRAWAAVGVGDKLLLTRIRGTKDGVLLSFADVGETVRQVERRLKREGIVVREVTIQVEDNQDGR